MNKILSLSESEAMLLRGLSYARINCFCMFSNYQPMTLDEWIRADAYRRAAMKECCDTIKMDYESVDHLMKDYWV